MGSSQHWYVGGDGFWAQVTVVAYYPSFVLKYARRGNKKREGHQKDRAGVRH